jgi:protein gp37
MECPGGPAPHRLQAGGVSPKAGGRLLDGRTWDEFPAVGEAVPGGA